MKEKFIITLSFSIFISIMWLSSTTQTTNVKQSISEELTISPQESYIIEYINDVSPETTYVNEGPTELNFSSLEDCLLKPIETDVFTFGDAFQYYRQCLGSHSSFHWKGSTYTTLLSEEVIINVADSVEVKEETKHNEMSETR